MARSSTIAVRGAREHNLSGIDVDVPKERLVVVCGVSGSGKSSLAMATIAAEGRRRFLQTMTTSPGRRPLVDLVSGIPPTVALEQRTGAVPSRRATVSTQLDLHAQLATVWVAVGTMHCPTCGRPLPVTPPSRILDQLTSMAPGTRLTILAPVSRDEPAEATVTEIARQGFVRVRWNGSIERIEELSAEGTGDLDVVIDRIQLDADKRPRLEDSVHQALAAGSGRIIVLAGDDSLAFSDHPYCQEHDIALSVPNASQLSFTTSAGACPRCKGTGEGESRELCPECDGSRLGPTARLLEVDGVSFRELLRLDLDQATARLGTLDHPGLTPVFADLTRRLTVACRLHLGHLPLGRALHETSTTEWLRLRLAALLGTDLSGVLFVLDEPTDGLDDARTEAVLDLLRQTLGRGCSLIVVGHDPKLLEAADHIVELGPGAGSEGGRIVFEGAWEDLERAATITAQSLVGARRPTPRSRGGEVTFALDPPLTLLRGAINVITGPPGCGKTTLMGQLIEAHRHGNTNPVFERLLDVPRSPLGRSATSCVATASRVWEPLRQLLAQTKEARIRGFGPDQFSFSKASGSCASCGGAGTIMIALEHLPPYETLCETCGGRRFDSATLSVTFKGLSAADVLDLTVSQALQQLTHQRRIATRLHALDRVGLGYLRLGQPSDSLSGGEAQRLRLARELARGGSDQALACFDGPSSGLHPMDLDRLLGVFEELAAGGLTVVCADLHPRVVDTAHNRIDLSR